MAATANPNQIMPKTIKPPTTITPASIAFCVVALLIVNGPDIVKGFPIMAFGFFPFREEKPAFRTKPAIYLHGRKPEGITV